MLQALKAEKADLIEQNGKIGLKFRELESRNKRQEDFIFDVQKKITALEAKNEELLEQINAKELEEQERQRLEYIDKEEDQGP